jgi:hypothetical protein
MRRLQDFRPMLMRDLPNRDQYQNTTGSQRSSFLQNAASRSKKKWTGGSVCFDGNRNPCHFFKYPSFPGKVAVVVHKMFIGMPYGHPVHDGNKSNNYGNTDNVKGDFVLRGIERERYKNSDIDQ